MTRLTWLITLGGAQLMGSLGLIMSLNKMLDSVRNYRKVPKFSGRQKSLL